MLAAMCSHACRSPELRGRCGGAARAIRALGAAHGGRPDPAVPRHPLDQTRTPISQHVLTYYMIIIRR